MFSTACLRQIEHQPSAPHKHAVPQLSGSPPAPTLKCVITCSKLGKFAACACLGSVNFCVRRCPISIPAGIRGCSHMRRDLLSAIRSGFQLLQLVGPFSTWSLHMTGSASPSQARLRKMFKHGPHRFGRVKITSGKAGFRSDVALKLALRWLEIKFTSCGKCLGNFSTLLALWDHTDIESDTAKPRRLSFVPNRNSCNVFTRSSEHCKPRTTRSR